jgi:hypothetical protein
MTSPSATDANTADREIRDLVARYSDAVNRRDEKAWTATWAEEGCWQLLGQTKTGRAEVVAFWLELMPHVPWVLQLPSFGVIELDDDLTTASGRWYINEISKRPSGPGLTIGVYHDSYVCKGRKGRAGRDGRESGVWCFAHRRFDVVYSGPPDLSGKESPYPPDLFTADV